MTGGRAVTKEPRGNGFHPGALGWFSRITQWVSRVSPLASPQFLRRYFWAIPGNLGDRQGVYLGDLGSPNFHTGVWGVPTFGVPFSNLGWPRVVLSGPLGPVKGGPLGIAFWACRSLSLFALSFPFLAEGACLGFRGPSHQGHFWWGRAP